MSEARIFYQEDCNLSLLDGKTIAIIGYGSQGLSLIHISEIPLMVRPNTVLPLGNSEEGPEYDYADQVTFRVYAVSYTHLDVYKRQACTYRFRCKGIC